MRARSTWRARCRLLTGAQMPSVGAQSLRRAYPSSKSSWGWLTKLAGLPSWTQSMGWILRLLHRHCWPSAGRPWRRQHARRSSMTRVTSPRSGQPGPRRLPWVVPRLPTGGPRLLKDGSPRRSSGVANGLACLVTCCKLRLNVLARLGVPRRRSPAIGSWGLCRLSPSPLSRCTGPVDPSLGALLPLSMGSMSSTTPWWARALSR